MNLSKNTEAHMFEFAPQTAFSTGWFLILWLWPIGWSVLWANRSCRMRLMLEIDQQPGEVCTSWSLGKVTRLTHSASSKSSHVLRALHLPIQKKKDVDSHDGHLRRQRPWNATKTLWSRAFLLTLVLMGTPNSKHSELIWTRIQRASEMPKGWSLTDLGHSLHL